LVLGNSSTGERVSLNSERLVTRLGSSSYRGAWIIHDLERMRSAGTAKSSVEDGPFFVSGDVMF